MAFLPAVLFVLTASLLLILAARPPIEVHEGYLSIGRRVIPWMDIRRLDLTGWRLPLVVRITLFDDSRLLLLYPGDSDSCKALRCAEFRSAKRLVRARAHDSFFHPGRGGGSTSRARICFDGQDNGRTF